MSVALRKIKVEEAEQLATIANNKAIADNLKDLFPYPYSIENAKEFIHSGSESGEVFFGIYSQDELAGVIGIKPQSDVYGHSAEIGYWLGEPFWGKGIGTIAVGLASGYAFEQMGVKRLFAGIFENNESSKKVLLKNGFELEGIGKKAVLKNGVYLDEHRYAKLHPQLNDS